MAAIVDPDNQLDVEHLSAGIKGALPAYARPLFIRVLKSVPMTSTFKVIKRDFVKEGFDLHIIKDPLYFLNHDGVYRKFTEKDYDDVMNGKARLWMNCFLDVFCKSIFLCVTAVLLQWWA